MLCRAALGKTFRSPFRTENTSLYRRRALLKKRLAEPPPVGTGIRIEAGGGGHAMGTDKARRDRPGVMPWYAAFYFSRRRCWAFFRSEATPGRGPRGKRRTASWEAGRQVNWLRGKSLVITVEYYHNILIKLITRALGAREPRRKGAKVAPRARGLRTL